MGMIHPGAPFEIILDLAKLSGATTFIETGTYHGASTRWAAGHFESVFTMERAEGLYQQHHQALRALGNVEPLLGDSKNLLPKVVPRLANKPAVFWLDGHWSGGETAGEDDECPLLSELETLSQRQGDVILIDDARLFLSAPPAPHRPEQWPTFPEIARLLTKQPNPPFVQIIDDVIFSVPATEALKQRLIDYGRVRSKVFEKLLAKGRKRTLIQKFKQRLEKMTAK
jgi:hypothetical protein